MDSIKEQILHLNRISKKSFALYHKVALSIGVSDSALGLLCALQEIDSPCSQYDLCNELFIPKQTINSTVSSLQKMGLVFLTPIPGARNKKNIALTEAGKKFVKKNIDKLCVAEIDALGSLTSEERELYISLNQKYNDLLTEKINDILLDFKQD